MRSLAELLSSLPDDASRARVLRWSQEHFPVGQPADEPRPSPTAPGGDQADPALTIGDDVFDAPSPRRREPIHCEAEPAIASDALSVDPALFEPAPIDNDDLEIRAVDVDIPPATAAGCKPGKPAGVEALLRDFVAEFQRLALEWQVA